MKGSLSVNHGQCLLFQKLLQIYTNVQWKQDKMNPQLIVIFCVDSYESGTVSFVFLSNLPRYYYRNMIYYVYKVLGAIAIMEM